MSGAAIIALLAGIGLATAALAIAWGRLALRGLGYRAEVHPDHIFPGEDAELVVELTNAKGIAVPWLVTRDDISLEMAVRGGRIEPHHIVGRAQLVQFWSVGARERVRRRYHVTAPHRGLHAVGPAALRSGDPFGWREEQIEASVSARLLVYPHTYPLAAWRIVAERPFGLRPRSGWLLPDPAQVVGARPYRAGDPYRMVHWSATARLGSIQVKQTVPAHSVATAIFLDVRTAQHAWEGIDRPKAEAAIALAATVAREAIQAHGEVALFANTPLRDRASVVRLASAAGPVQLQRVLEALALGGVQPWSRIEDLLALDGRGLPRGVRVLVITPLCTAAVAAAVSTLARSGRRLDLFRVGDSHPVAAPDLPGLRSFRIGDAQVAEWFQDTRAPSGGGGAGGQAGEAGSGGAGLRPGPPGSANGTAPAGSVSGRGQPPAGGPGADGRTASVARRRQAGRARGETVTGRTPISTGGASAWSHGASASI